IASMPQRRPTRKQAENSRRSTLLSDSTISWQSPTCQTMKQWHEWHWRWAARAIFAARPSERSARPSSARLWLHCHRNDQKKRSSPPPSVDPEGRKIESGASARDQVGLKLADSAREFESVARARARHKHLRMLGMEVDDEIVIGGVGEEAHRRLAHRRGRQFREDRLESRAQRLDVFVSDLPIHALRIGNDGPVVHHRRLHPARQSGESVADRAGLELIGVNRKLVRVIERV